MAQTAAVIGLSATGPQDEYLFDEKAETFRQKTRQHTHFTKFHRTTYPNVNQFVGKTVDFVFNPKQMGDLLENMYLVVTIPSITQSGYSIPISNITTTVNTFINTNVASNPLPKTAVLVTTQYEHNLNSFSNIVTISGNSQTLFNGTMNVISITSPSSFMAFTNLPYGTSGNGGTLSVGTQYSWAPQIGRAIIEHVELRIGNNIVENITDLWYVIYDQLFLDADEKNALCSTMNGGVANETQSCSTSVSQTLCIPMNFFFCRRHSYIDRNRELIERPNLPLCALNENITLRIFFRPQSWFTDFPVPIEFTNVKVITEEIIISQEEKMYYLSKPLSFVINRSWTNPSVTYSQGVATQNFTVDFPVTMMCWFIRKKQYETSSNVSVRYNFGYYSPYATSVNSLKYFNGATVGYIDTIENCQIFLNGRDITGTFGTGPFFQYKQPMDHELTVPQNSIYTYCFGLSPKEYNQGGYLNFEKIDSQASKINIKFSSTYAADIQSSYNLYIYYYGYQVLNIVKGKTSLLYK